MRNEELSNLIVHLPDMRRFIGLQAAEQIQRLVERRLVEDSRNLSCYGFKAFSENDEDGMIQEVFRRLGIQCGTFVEFGCGDGLENNTTYLVQLGWTGVWIDGDSRQIEQARSSFRSYIDQRALVVHHENITVDNVNELLSQNLKSELDLMSIDIDGNDYWVWKAVHSVNPKVVIIEYNATFRPPSEVVQVYNPDYCWDGSNHFGASLSSLVALADLKGYSLIGCCLAGVNALFLRNDLVNNNFRVASCTALYEPPRYGIFRLVSFLAHPPNIGLYLTKQSVTI